MPPTMKHPSGGISRLALYSWNVDYMLPFAAARMAAALEALQDTIAAQADTAAVVIFLQECVRSDLETLAESDFNAIQDFDRTLHADHGLRDAYLELRGREDCDEAYTWGQQARTVSRDMYGCSRMDKVFFHTGGSASDGDKNKTAAIKLLRFERFGTASSYRRRRTAVARSRGYSWWRWGSKSFGSRITSASWPCLRLWPRK